MHDCFFAAQYLPTAGGVERYTFNLARRLAAAGHRVTVVTSALPGLPAQETDENGIEIVRLPCWRLLGGRLPVIRPNAAFRRAAKRLWAQDVDFCVINTYFYPLSLYAARQTKRRGVRAILVNHGSAWLMTGNPLLAFAGRLYERAAARIACRDCPRFYGVSGAACDWLAAFHIQAKGILTNAVDPDELAAGAAAGRANWRTFLGLAPDTPLIAFAGRMIPEKGVQELCEAMALIRRQVPRAALVLAGGGPLLETVRAAAQPGVFAAGAQSYPDTLALLAQADVFCLPTRSEGFAGTVLEAAALGCPILTTATGGSPQLLPDESFGILLADRAPQTIAAACIRALQSPAWRARAAEKARARLLENYTWDRAVEALRRIEKEGTT